ncbi:hypothetical protein ACS0TY_008712 [Phlomoides rotata]
MRELKLNPTAAAAVVLLCCFSAIGEAGKRKTFRLVENGPFNETHYQQFEVEKPATISNDALQMTPDSASADFNLFNNSGRVLLKHKFKLWDGDGLGPNTSVASFNTSFLFNIYSLGNDTAGVGLAFLISPNLNIFPANIAPIGLKFFNIWVDYDGENRIMQVYNAEQAERLGPTPRKPDSPTLSRPLDLTDHVNQYSYFGFSASTGSTKQLISVLRWNLTVHYFSDDNQDWLKIVLGAGVPAVVLLVMGAAALGYYCYRRRLALSNPNLVVALNSLPGTPREFDFRDLKKATNGFDENSKLGQGGYGEVFYGLLVKENLEIAVKRFSRESIKGQDDFLAELTIINRLRHRHLVKLLGWCHKNGKLLLVYEYMPNGSLDKHLFVGPDVDPLGWNLRYKIVSGIASALHYLHNEYDQRVVHRDLKASNIMLDSNFNARLGDFGLARALENEKTSYAEAEGVLGTMGYIAPECFLMGKATQQSDVYAFGAVLLELVCGKRPGTRVGRFQLVVDWVWYLHRDGKLLEAVDPRLGDNYVVEEAERLLLLGLACSHPIASERPRTQVIVQMVTGTMPVPVVPPFKPPFVWPAARPMDTDLESGSEATTLTTGWSGQYISR